MEFLKQQHLTVVGKVLREATAAAALANRRLP